MTVEKTLSWTMSGSCTKYCCYWRGPGFLLSIHWRSVLQVSTYFTEFIPMSTLGINIILVWNYINVSWEVYKTFNSSPLGRQMTLCHPNQWTVDKMTPKPAVEQDVFTLRVNLSGWRRANRGKTDRKTKRSNNTKQKVVPRRLAVAVES